MKNKRIELHSQAKQYMNHGQYAQAAELLRGVLSQHGSHVGLLSDLIASEYMLGQVDSWVLNLKKLIQELKSCRTQLSPDSLGKTLIFIGKMSEELGNLSHAIKSFQEASEIIGLNREIRLNSLAQSLRIKSYLGIHSDISSLYILTSHSYVESGFHIIEVEHSLILAELALFGQHTAANRLQNIWNHKASIKSDKNLILFDYLEYLYRRQLEPDNMTLELLKECDHNTLDAYENFLFHFLILKIIPILEPRHLSPFAYLKCLAMMLNSDQKITQADEILKNIFIRLDYLDRDSRMLLMSFLKIENYDQNVNFLLDTDNGILFKENSQLSVKSKGFSTKCLTALANYSEIATDDFIKEVFQESHISISSIEKTRIAIQRLNSDLRKQFGISKTIEFSKCNISLNKKITIKILNR